MSRPQKYTDSDIHSAIEFLSATGQEVNPMRVRIRLGGGNMTRIKALVEKRRSDQVAQGTAVIRKMPETLSREFQQLSQEASQQMIILANRCWTAALSEAASVVQDENAQLRRRVEKLESELADATDLVARMELERDHSIRDLESRNKERDDLARQCGDLKAALRNAESDLRATQKIIDNFERNQQQDRNEIRQWQKRVEDLIAEISVLKGGALKGDTSHKTSGTGKRNRNL